MLLPTAGCYGSTDEAKLVNTDTAKDVFAAGSKRVYKLKTPELGAFSTGNIRIVSGARLCLTLAVGCHTCGTFFVEWGQGVR